MRPCLDCGVPTTGSRCPTHQRQWILSHRGTTTQQGYGRAWRRLAEAAVREHVASHGWLCPGWKRPSHPSRDLTADHPIAKANGGPVLPDQIDVLCRSCNSSKGISLLDADGRRSAEGTRGGGGRTENQTTAASPSQVSRSACKMPTFIA
jgi:5-methylcytosine-specific restriction enzyme A